MKDHILEAANDSTNLVNLLNALLDDLRLSPTKEFLDEFLISENEGAVIEFLRHDGWQPAYDWPYEFVPDIEPDIFIAP
jgi:hypothetical protein